MPKNKYRETIEEIFHRYYVSPDPEFVEAFGLAIAASQNSQMLAIGPPGVGKGSLLAVAAYHLTGDAKNYFMQTCDERLEPGDFIYEGGAEIHQEAKDVQKYVFPVKPRPFMEATFAHLPDFNRLSTKTRNALLPIFQERQYSYYGQVLKRADGIIVCDLNPYYSTLDWAFMDRFRVVLPFPALQLGGRVEMLRRAYTKDNAKHAGNIVSESMQDKPMMTLQELKEAWKQVSEVELPTGALDTTAVMTSTFSACIYDLSQVHSAFKLPCETCKFHQTCVTTKLEHPLFQRNDHHVVAVMKARAFWHGRDAVEVQEDMLPALQLVMLHRAAPTPKLAANYPTLQEWYKCEVQDLITELQRNWRQAQTTIKDIKQTIKQAQGDDTKLGEAIFAYNKAIEDVADVQSMKIVKTIEEQVNALSQSRFMKVYANCHILAQGDYTSSDLDELKKSAEFLSASHAQEVMKEVAKLEGRLRGIRQVTRVEALKIMAELSAADGTMLDLREWGDEKYNLKDGTELEVRKEHDKYVFDYNAKSSKIARILRSGKA